MRTSNEGGAWAASADAAPVTSVATARKRARKRDDMARSGVEGESNGGGPTRRDRNTHAKPGTLPGPRVKRRFAVHELRTARRTVLCGPIDTDPFPPHPTGSPIGGSQR